MYAHQMREQKRDSASFNRYIEKSLQQNPEVRRCCAPSVRNASQAPCCNIGHAYIGLKRD